MGCLGGCANKQFDVFDVLETPVLEVSGPLWINLKVRIMGFRLVDVEAEAAKKEDDDPKPAELGS